MRPQRHIQPFQTMLIKLMHLDFFSHRINPHTDRLPFSGVLRRHRSEIIGFSWPVQVLSMYVQNMTLRCFYHPPSSDFFGFSRPGRNMLTFVQREYKNGCFQFIKIRCIKFTLTVFLRSNTTCRSWIKVRFAYSFVHSYVFKRLMIRDIFRRPDDEI